MNRLIILILLLITLASCQKIYNVHFHGHIINGCDSTPAANIQIDIARYYDTGTEQANDVGIATTNSDGYYELIADVSTKGSFGYYGVFLLGISSQTSWVDITHTENATADSKDVLIDGLAVLNEPFNFHIKNTNPFDNNDSFNFLSYLNDHNYWVYLIIDSTFHGDPHNLAGKFVDFNYSYDLPNTQPDYYFKYSFTKNGATVEKDDTVHMSCLGTTEVDIFY